MEKQSFSYIENGELKNLEIESDVIAFADDKSVNNPTGDDTAYFYVLSVNWQSNHTTFAPWKEWYTPMTREEALSYLAEEIEQTKRNFGIQ